MRDDLGFDAQEPLPSVPQIDSIDSDALSDLLLTDDEFAALGAKAQAEYLALVGDLVDRWSLDDNPRQQTAELVAPYVDLLLFGGAAGGGKSEWLCYHAYHLSINNPGHVSLLLRTTLPELRRSLIRRMQIRFAQMGVAAKLRRNDNLTAYYFPNGSIIEFGFCNSEGDVDRYLSAEYDFIGFDEASKFSPYAIQMIQSRCRTTTAKRSRGIHPHVALGTNPGGLAHRYLKRLCIDGTNKGAAIAVYNVDNGGLDTEAVLDGKIIASRLLPFPLNAEQAQTIRAGIDETSEITVGFVPSLVSDNPHIDPAYIKRLKALNATDRAQYLEGDWDAIEDRAFPMFSRAIHVVAPYPVPDDRWFACGIDYGYTAPAVCLWGAWDEHGHLHVYRESKLTQYSTRQQAQTWKNLSRDEALSMVLADRSTHQQNDQGPSIAQQWRNAGWRTSPANNARVPGWSNLRAYLEVDPATGTPWMTVGANCQYLIDTLATIERDKKNPEDVDTKADDHACDALRYLAQARPIRDIVRRTFTEEAHDLQSRVKRKIDRLAKTTRRGT